MGMCYFVVAPPLLICCHLRFSVLQGAGTAIGELPPYFMARAARISGHEDDDPDYEQIEAVLHSQRRDPLTRAKKAVHRLVQRVGFFGILLCASVSYTMPPFTYNMLVNPYRSQTHCLTWLV